MLTTFHFFPTRLFIFTGRIIGELNFLAYIFLTFPVLNNSLVFVLQSQSDEKQKRRLGWVIHRPTVRFQELWH